MRIKSLIGLIIYYSIGRYLPVSHSSLSFKLTKPFRGFLCKLIFKKCGKNMNKKICFVSLGSYPLLNTNDELKFVGGAELRQVLIGKELAKRGYSISFITYGDGVENANFLINDINIIQSYPYICVQKLSLYKKMRKIYKCLKNAASDIYIHSSGSAGFVSLYCFIHRIKFIYWVASDKNVLLEGVAKKTSLYIKIALYLDIKLADLVITQNNFQKEIVERKFKKSCVLIKNPITISDEIFKTNKNKNLDNIILWVGKIMDIKRPELFLKLAETLPQYKFKMIGGLNDQEPELYSEIKEKSNKLSNLEFLGFIPHHEIQKYYEEATILVNTSKVEGFPNTFLEAWLNCIPVVSLNVDPDEIICEYKLGFHSKTLNQLIEDVRLLSNDCEFMSELGMNGRSYVETNHNVKNIVNSLQKFL